MQHLQSVMLQNEYFLTNIGFDTAEYEPARMRQEVVKRALAWSKSDGSALGCISAKQIPVLEIIFYTSTRSVCSCIPTFENSLEV